MTITGDPQAGGEPQADSLSLAGRVVPGRIQQLVEWTPRFNFSEPKVILGWIVLNVACAQAMHLSVGLATLIGAVQVFAVFYVGIKAQNLVTLIAAIGFAGMSDTLWRMTHAKIPWELAKYACIILIVTGLVRFVGRAHNTILPFLYFVSLLPAAAAAFYAGDFTYARSEMAFVLAGPLLLALATTFYSQVRAEWSSANQMLWCMVGPVAGVCSIASVATSKLTTSAFAQTVSSDAAAGGYGANQVADILALGLLLVILIALRDLNWLNRSLAIILGVWFFAQSALTLSRGGLFSVGVALVLAAPQLIADKKLGLRFAVAGLFVALMLTIIVLPRLEDFTGGAVGRRAQSQDTTMRGQLAAIDMHLFYSHPVFGVGVGNSDKAHAVVNGFALASHTEFTRMLAEHGMLGVLALLCMVGMLIQAYVRQDNWFGRAWCTTMAVWSLTAMAHSGTRIAAIPLLFGLASLAIDQEGPDDEDDARWHLRRSALQQRRRASDHLAATWLTQRRAYQQARAAKDRPRAAASGADERGDVLAIPPSIGHAPPSSLHDEGSAPAAPPLPGPGGPGTRTSAADVRRLELGPLDQLPGPPPRRPQGPSEGTSSVDETDPPAS